MKFFVSYQAKDSPHYFRSAYCMQELDAALTGQTNRLLPIRLQECDPGAFLQNRIHIDLARKTIDEARDALLGGVEAYVAQTLKGSSSQGSGSGLIFRARRSPLPNRRARRRTNKTQAPSRCCS
jgi:hypothetical protein